MATNISVTAGLGTWKLQQSHIERPMDSSAYEAAHPDDTLVLAGPARMASVDASNSQQTAKTLLAIGMLQSIQITQSKPTQPMMAIGSGRSFFVSGKSQTQWTIGRLFLNGRNLLRVLYHNFVAANGDAAAFDDPSATTRTSTFFTNLDSELFYVPFGLGVLFRDKVHNMLGSMYIELAMINSHAIGVTAGQNAILENVSGMADRVLPWTVSDGVTSGTAMQTTLDQVLDFTEPFPGQTPAPINTQSLIDGVNE